MDEYELLSAGGPLEQRLDPEAQRLRHAVCPLFKPRGLRIPELRGCGVAYTDGRQHFILTAGHVVDALEANDFHAWTPASWIMARGQIARTNPRGKRPDIADAAVIRLDREVVNGHVKQHSLTRMDIDPPGSHFGKDHLMQLISYPGGKVNIVDEKLISPTWYQWAGVGANESDYKKRGRRTDVHTLLRFNRREATHKDLGRHPGPDMHGASGGGIWRTLPVGEDRTRKRWSLLTGIFTTYEGRTIIGTRPQVHLALIDKYFKAK